MSHKPPRDFPPPAPRAPAITLAELDEIKRKLNERCSPWRRVFRTVWRWYRYG